VGATPLQRLEFARENVVVSHFVHWLLGVAFMIHVAVLVAVLREVVRPEVLWFLRNPEEAIEHPLRDLIDEPVPKHARRIILCLILYLPLTVVLVYLPATAARMLAPSAMFPLYVSLDCLTDVPPEVILLHVSLPHIMEHCRPRNSFKKMLEAWIEIVGTWLGLRDRMLPVREDDLVSNTPPASPHAQPNTAGGGYVADDEGPDSPSDTFEQDDGAQMWARPDVTRRPQSQFVRGLFMMGLAWLSIALIGAATMIMSLLVGRGLLRVLVPQRVKHDVYAFGIGFCICSTSIEMAVRLHQRLLTQRASSVMRVLAARLQHMTNCAVAVFVMGGVVAALLGLVLDLVLIVPFRLSFYQSPELLGVGQWMGGLVSLKVGCNIFMNTPSLAPLAPHLHTGLVEAYERGWRHLDLLALLDKVALPMMTHLVLLLAVPYLLSWGVLPHFGHTEMECSAIWRWSYPGVTTAALTLQFLQRTWRALSQVHDALRDSLYLVGRRLHNLPVVTPAPV